MIQNQDRPIFPQQVRSRNTKKYELKAEDELRIYEIQEFLRIRLLEGQAEIFGRELPKMETVIYFKGQNLAIFTWKGATIEIEDHDHHIYHDHRSQHMGGYEQKSQMRELVNLNHILEQMRLQALSQKYSGPRVFITGN